MRAFGWVIGVAGFAAGLAAASPVRAADFTLGLAGPRNVAAGHTLYVVLTGNAVDAAAQGVELTVSGLPDGVEWDFPDLAGTCCGNKADGYWAYLTPFDTALALKTSHATPAGSYTVTVTGKGKATQAVGQASYQITVGPLPPAPTPPPLQLPAIPMLSEWEQQMTTSGLKHCDEAAIQAGGLAETGVWYYDGTRVFYQIADYTQQATWNACAGHVREVYRKYVLDNSGAIPGWRVFPHGLRMDYERTSDELSKQAALDLYENAAGAKSSISWVIDPSVSREVAYGTNAKLTAARLGVAEPVRLDVWVDVALGHIDMWFVSKNYTDRLAPFMVGLTTEALIGWYEKTADPRVPVAVKTALDAIWETLWVPAQKAFYYEQVLGEAPSTPAPDLNLLIAPAYAWLYRQTGEVKYRDAADVIFEGGVQGAWLEGGKQFSQNYRWSFDYVRWRTEPGPSPDGGAGGSGGGAAGSAGQGGALPSDSGAAGAQAGASGSTSDAGVGGATAAAPLPEDGGCGCKLAGSHGGLGWLVAMAGAAVLALRRRTRR